MMRAASFCAKISRATLGLKTPCWRLPTKLSWREGACIVGGIITSTSSSAQLPPPPKETAVDANGVDVRTGNITFEAREVDIGPEGELGLQLTRYIGNGTTRDSFSSTFYAAESPDYNSSTSASFGNIGDSFGSFGTDTAAFYGPSDDPATPRYQHRSGTIVTFGKLLWEQNNPFGEPSYDLYRLATHVAYPSGSALQIHYKQIPGSFPPSVRIQSVTNNAGYQIKFLYASNDISNRQWTRRIAAVAINMASEYCDPIADECALTMPWPTATYASANSGGTATLTVTDASGGVTSYRTIVGSVASPNYFIALPGMHH